MHPFHERLARIALQALASRGFALAGGYAVQAHGIVNRLSEDIDLFTTMDSEAAFPEAVRLAVANKVTALYSRAQARDYIDVDAAAATNVHPYQLREPA